MSDDFLSFDNDLDKLNFAELDNLDLNLNDFQNFTNDNSNNTNNVNNSRINNENLLNDNLIINNNNNETSAIDERELLEFNNFLQSSEFNTNNDNNNNFNNIKIEDNTNVKQEFDQIDPFDPQPLSHSNPRQIIPNATHLDPNQLLNSTLTPGSYNSNYISPISSPYNSSFQPQSIQQSLSQSLSSSKPISRPRQGSIPNSYIASTTRKNSIYDTNNLDSIASPQPSILSESNNLNPTYFSPITKSRISIPTNNNSRQASLQINSPNDFSSSALSPISSFDPSSFRSPRSSAVSPIPTGLSLGTSLSASLGTPLGDGLSGSLPKQSLTKEDKLRRRREFHNQVERRRRDLIKEKIKELSLIVPPSLLYVDEEGKEIKASKTVIINKTVDYLAHLHKVMKEQEVRRQVLLQKIEELEKISGTLSNDGSTSKSTSFNNSPDINLMSGSNSDNNNNNNNKNNNNNSNGTGNENIVKSEIEFDVNEFLKEHNETWDHSNT